MGRRSRQPDSTVSYLPTPWQVLTFVYDDPRGRVYRVEQRTLSDGSKETRQVEVTRERFAGALA